jgi:hypothetical protein
MKKLLLGIGKALLCMATVALTVVGGFWAGMSYCEHFVVPGWVKQYPHDGQLGLGVLGYGIFGAFAALVGLGIVVLVLILRSGRDRRPEEDEVPREPGNDPIQLHLK